jgi:hypothetical protein
MYGIEKVAFTSLQKVSRPAKEDGQNLTIRPSDGQNLTIYDGQNLTILTVGAIWLPGCQASLLAVKWCPMGLLPSWMAENPCF